MRRAEPSRIPARPARRKPPSTLVRWRRRSEALRPVRRGPTAAQWHARRQRRQRAQAGRPEARGPAVVAVSRPAKAPRRRRQGAIMMRPARSRCTPASRGAWRASWPTRWRRRTTGRAHSRGQGRPTTA
eukprot:1971619-Prymnesium_polylepis.1